MTEATIYDFGDPVLRAFEGKKITNIYLAANSAFGRGDSGTNELVIELDGALISIHDLRNCCERRYMQCDDDLAYFAGSTLAGLDLLSAENAIEVDGDQREKQFLIVRTSKGDAAIANYNEHNGYYSGFNLRAEVVT